MEFRVFGPPGTGKTTWLTGQIRRAVEDKGPDSVMVASFTKSAAVELAGRDLPLPDSRIGTLHAFCYRQLGMPTIAETKIGAFNAEHGAYTMSSDAVDIDEPEQKYDNAGDRLMAQMQTYRARMVPREKWSMETLGFARAWDNFKRDNNYIDFTDMVEMCYLEGYPPPGAPLTGFFDEVQDFTMLELSLIRQWSTHMKNVILAGDDDQCIYGFKGATPLAFLYPELPDAQRRVLAQSWRMPRAVYDYSQTWVHQIKERQEKPFEPRAEVGSVDNRPELRYRNAEALVTEAAARAEAGESVMIIGACSYQIAGVVKQLRDTGELFHNPYRRKRGDWNPLQGALIQRTGANSAISTAARAMAFLRPSRAVHGDAARPYTYGDLRLWTHALRKTGVIRRGMSRVIEQGAQDEPVTQATIDAVFEESAIAPIMRCNFGWFADHAETSKRRYLDYIGAVGKRKGFTRLLDTPKITVGTIHSVKGGEADTVFLLPDLSPAGYMEYANDSSRDSVYRQFYVGMTRAKTNLVLCGPSTSQAIRWL